VRGMVVCVRDCVRQGVPNGDGIMAGSRCVKEARQKCLLRAVCAEQKEKVGRFSEI